MGVFVPISDYSDPVCHCTSGTVPSQTDPPMLSEQSVKALTISWIRRPSDDSFTLQMEDEATVGRLLLVKLCHSGLLICVLICVSHG